MRRRKQDCPKRMKWELENLRKLKRFGAEKLQSQGVVKMQDVLIDDDEVHEGSEDNENGEIEEEESTSDLEQNSTKTDLSHETFVNRNGHSETSMPIDSPLDLSTSQVKPIFTRKLKSTKIGKLRHGAQFLAPNGRLNPVTWNQAPEPFPINQDLTQSALDKLSQLNRSGGGSLGSSSTSPSSLDSRGSTSGISSWQAQWLAQSSNDTKKVLRCVSCQLPFPTLAQLSVHMKEARHGPQVRPFSTSPPKPPTCTSAGPQNHHQNSRSPTLKETIQLPRKLVRGQDVWLGKGAEQTRQILKCMWCGTSFRTLADMTSHMQETQHYTNIISQEQLISWKSSSDNKSSSIKSSCNSSSSTVNAVLTCKVCDQRFSSLKYLSNHMIKNSHHKEHLLKSMHESGSGSRRSHGRGQSHVRTEKRKKSLPVRELLELERSSSSNSNNTNNVNNDEMLISCEKCWTKIPTNVFTAHLRICNSNKEKSLEGDSDEKIYKRSRIHIHKLRQNHGIDVDANVDNVKFEEGSRNRNEQQKKWKKSSGSLNAIKKMFEVSFETHKHQPNHGSNHGLKIGSNDRLGGISPLGATSSMLKRLGIDESGDYKPLVHELSYNQLHKSHTSEFNSSSLHSTSPTPPQSQSTLHIHPSPQQPDSSASASSRNNTPNPSKSFTPSNSPDLKDINKSSSQSSEEDEDKDKSTSKSSTLLNLMHHKSQEQQSNKIENPNPNSSSNLPSAMSALQRFCDNTTTNESIHNTSRPTSTNSFSTSSPISNNSSPKFPIINNNTNVIEPPLLNLHKKPKNNSTKYDDEEKMLNLVDSNSSVSKFIKYSQLAKQLSSK